MTHRNTRRTQCTSDETAMSSCEWEGMIIKMAVYKEQSEGSDSLNVRQSILSRNTIRVAGLVE